MEEIVHRFAATVAVDPDKESRKQKLLAFAEKRFSSVHSPPRRGYKPRPKIKNQEERRKILLQEQKNKRDEALNRSRGLLDLIASQDENDEDDEFMDYTVAKAKKVPYYRNHLMMSEWLLEVPTDLDTSWYVVPCPLGRRTLIVSTRKGTRAYSKSGYLLASFPSILPRSTMLDCIWSPTCKSYFILDVLMWNNQTLTECETEFRSFWVRTKLEEANGALSKTNLTNIYPFYGLEYKLCTRNALEEIIYDPQFGSTFPSLDGLLFYHKHTHYTSGSTPLVGWLKPYMLNEMFGINPGDRYLTDMPEGYTCLTKYLQQLEQLTPEKRKWRRKKGMKMETEVISSPEKMENEEIIEGETVSEECMS